MIKLQKQKTKRLFYGKWPYKVATICEGGSYIKSLGVTYCKTEAENGVFQGRPYQHIDNAKLADFCDRYEKISKENLKIRFEGSHVNFFTESKSQYLNIVNIMGDFVSLISEPEDDSILETLQSDKKFVVVDTLPYRKYTNKIILKCMPENQRKNLHNLLKKYGKDKIRISKTTESYLDGKRFYMQDPFIYVEEEKMLTILALAANGYIKKTEKFVLKSSINTCLDQEQTCQPLVKV